MPSVHLHSLLCATLAVVVGLANAADQRPQAYVRKEGLDGPLVIGTSGGWKVSHALTMEFGRIYRINPTGSYSGSHAPSVRRFVGGKVKLIVVDRPLSSGELSEFERRHGYAASVAVIGFDGPAIFVNVRNPIRQLSYGHLTAIFAADKAARTPAAITWGDVGATGDWAVKALQPFVNDDYWLEREFRSRQLQASAWHERVRIVRGASKALDYAASELGGVAIGLLSHRHAGIRPVALTNPTGEPIDPTAENCRNGRYPLAQAVLLYAAIEPNGQDSLTGEFFAFATSLEGQSAVSDAGCVAGVGDR